MHLSVLLVSASALAALCGCASSPSDPTSDPIAHPPRQAASSTPTAPAIERAQPLRATTATLLPTPASGQAARAAPSRAVARPEWMYTVRTGGPAPEPTLTGDYARYPAALALIDELERKRGFDRAYLYDLFSRVQRQDWILDYLSRPKAPSTPGPTGRWTRYRAKFLTEDRIREGARFWLAHADALARAEARYGVPAHYIVAIIGVETYYGANTGSHKVINALATLAFDYPRRADYFRGELEAFLVMARDEGFDPFEPVGSYAGAMGLGQFMPSSFHGFAVDFDGDGYRDLWSPADAIGSVANYFSGHGWRSGEAVAVPARTRGGGARALKADYTTSYSLDTLARHGVSTRVPLREKGEVSLLRLDGRGGYEYWLGLHNFYVITRYNHSTYYAMAVHQLAQAIRARHERMRRRLLTGVEQARDIGAAVVTGWPYAPPQITTLEAHRRG